MENNKVGNFIAEMRKKKKLTQKQLGDKLYITDKAVSKWERGLSLPDITLLSKLAEIFEIEVEDILSGEINKNKKNINIDERIKELQISIETRNKKQKKKYITIIGIIVALLLIVILKNIHLGYSIKEYNYNNSKIKLGIPKTSFNIKNIDRSYSYYNFSSSTIIKNEIKNYLKTLKYSTCNETIYYYDKTNNISVIDYKVKDYILFSKVDMLVDTNDYCYNQKVNEYGKYIENTNYAMNYSRKVIEGKPEVIEGKIYYAILLDSNNKNDFKVNVTVVLQHNTYGETLEESIGTYEIRNGKYVYIRDEIKKKDNRIKIPTVSTFKIDNKKLILEENYLSKYTNKVELESVK